MFRCRRPPKVSLFPLNTFEMVARESSLVVQLDRRQTCSDDCFIVEVLRAGTNGLVVVLRTVTVHFAQLACRSIPVGMY